MRLLLPQAAAQLVPVLNNARMPGRAMTMVALSASVLVAITLAQVRWTPRRRAGGLAVAVLALAELLATPLPLADVPEPGVYFTVQPTPVAARCSRCRSAYATASAKKESSSMTP